jgi:UDP-GlcNAc:undecaprenyl-phosphate GlcNAc-1-phosphate transferase
VPIVDTAFAIVRRTVRRTGLAVRDLEHLHHRLMRLGHGHRRSVIVLWTWTFLLSVLVLYPTFYPSWKGAIPIGFLVMAAALYTLFLPGLRRDPSLEGAATTASTADQGVDSGQVGVGEGTLARPAAGGVAGAALGAETGSGEVRRELVAGGHRGQHRRRFARHHPPTRG